MRKWGLVICYAFVGLSLCFAAWTVTTGGSASITGYDGTADKYVSKSLTVSRGTSSPSAAYFYILISGAGIDGHYQVDDRRLYVGTTIQASNIQNNSLQVFLQRTSTSGAAEIGATNGIGTYVTSGVIPAGSSSVSSIPFFVCVRRTEGVVPAATYKNTFNYSVYTTDTTPCVDAGFLLTTTSATPVCSGTMTVSVASITSAASFSLTLSPSTVNFLSLYPTSNPSSTIQMSIKAPANFAVAAQSGNLGLLKNANTSDTLAYHLVYNSTSVSLTGGIVQLFSNSVGTGGVAQNFPLTIVLDEVGIKDVYTYTDNLYLTFTTQ